MVMPRNHNVDPEVGASISYQVKRVRGSIDDHLLDANLLNVEAFPECLEEISFFMATRLDNKDALM
jgi:hypothetical protein